MRNLLQQFQLPIFFYPKSVYKNMLWVNLLTKENCFADAITGFHCRRRISPEAIILLPPTIHCDKTCKTPDVICCIETVSLKQDH